jgi:glycosyltransferase involved in cell wall biosynthesis
MRVSVIGDMAYHHDTIIKPLLTELESRVDLVAHVPASLDFFTEQQSFTLHMPGAVASIPAVAMDSDVIILTDFWNPLVPIIASLCYAHDIPVPKLCSIFHGGIEIQGDLCHGIEFARDYEAYLNTVYHRVAVPACCLHLCNARGKVASPFPWVGPPLSAPGANRTHVYFPHRFAPDKGSEDFIEIARAMVDTDLVFAVFGDRPYGWDFPPNMIFLGRQPRAELFARYRKGGWVWSSVKSEIYAYAVREALACGLTPCVNSHPAYDFIPERFRYWSLDDAEALLRSNATITDEEHSTATQGWGSHTSELVSNLLGGL